MLVNWSFVLIFAEQDNLKLRDKGGKHAKWSHVVQGRLQTGI